MDFQQPYYFILFVIPVAMLVWYYFKSWKTHASLLSSSTRRFDQMPKTWKVYLRHLPILCRVGAISLLIVVLARPQSTDKWSNSSSEGIDIMMSVDISSSMLAADLKPNRLEAAKEVAQKFIANRPNDNIGLVVFSAESFTQCPLTTDHAVLSNLFQNIECGMIDDGTAIGLGIANAVSRLKDSKAKSKVIILLTDGSNNMGDIAPTTAAEIAQTYGIRIYTIGVGTLGEAPYPFQTPFGIQYQNVKVDIDESTLTKIAQITHGEYFRATDNRSLAKIYEQIDKLEKTIINVREVSKREEEYLPFAIAAFLLILLELVARFTFLRSIP